ncbi:MAG: hypothetical protein C4538_10865 [Nitrospiraceae bacterium]|nr:MAG: hypothetical protein C4538_10865 [Nitrospiraceae bacterium]
MSKEEKPLPKPPSTPFGKKRSSEDENNKEPLMADQMAIAMSEGKLEEFLQSNIPDSEYARKLAEMMMGMTGMMPAEGFPSPPAEKISTQEKSSGAQPPEDVISAVQSGDVKSVIEILAREHAKRTGSSVTDAAQEEKTAVAPSPDSPTIDKDVIEQFIKIASENGLSLDWLLLRALKRYVEEYKKNGNL